MDAEQNYTYKLYINILLTNISNIVTVEIFKLMFDRFNVESICNLPKKYFLCPKK
jgi:hypothetical protein